MDIVIKKLDLIDDVQNEIIKFCYNESGFTNEQEKAIIKIKNFKKLDLLRIKVELWMWHKSGLSINWLKPTKGGCTGYYTTEDDENRSYCIAFTHGFINQDEFFDLGGRLCDVMSLFH